MECVQPWVLISTLILTDSDAVRKGLDVFAPGNNREWKEMHKTLNETISWVVAHHRPHSFPHAVNVAITINFKERSGSAFTAGIQACIASHLCAYGCRAIGLHVCCCVTEAALHPSSPKRAHHELITVLQDSLGGSHQTGTFRTNCKMNPVEFKTKAARVEFDTKDSFDVFPHCWAENPMMRAEAPKSPHNSEARQHCLAFGEAVPVRPGGCWALLRLKPWLSRTRRHWVLCWKPKHNRFNDLMRINCAHVQLKALKHV